MIAKTLDGRALTAGLKQELVAEAAELAASGRPARLAALGFAGDEAGAAYARRLGGLCGELGIAYGIVEAPADVSTDEAVEAVRGLNQDPEVSGILIVLPPPAQVDTARLVQALDLAKDVDGAHPDNAAALYLGTPGPAPATAIAVLELLRRYDVALDGRHVVVVGRSNVVGKPLGLLLLRENATVTICHSRTPDIGAHARRADVLVAAAGSPGLITADMVSPAATVIDVGTNYVDGKLIGDVRYEEVAERAAQVTPVPGGVGPLTNLMLVRNLIDLTRGRESASGRVRA